MREMRPISAREMNHRTRFAVGLTRRKVMEGDVASVFQRMAWPLTPRQIPKAFTGNRRRKGHFSSSGRTDTSVACSADQSRCILLSVQACQPEQTYSIISEKMPFSHHL